MITILTVITTFVVFGLAIKWIFYDTPKAVYNKIRQDKRKRMLKKTQKTLKN